MTRYERELLRRCVILMAGSLFFFILAAIRANSGDYGGYDPYGNAWAYRDADDQGTRDLTDEQLLSVRLQRRLVGREQLNNTRRKAAMIHDSVTILIRESTSSEITSSNDLKRDANQNMTLNNWLTPSFSGGLGAKQHGEQAGGNTPTISWSSGRAHKSDSTIERTQYLTSTLTGTVTEVKPNGYLVVQASKTINVNGEEQMMTVTGMVNPNHMDSTSTVKAEYIIDMRVSYTGKGPMTRMDKRGWASKAIDFLNPF